MAELTGKRYGNAYLEEFAKAFKEGMRSMEASGNSLLGVELKTTWMGNSGFDRQLKLVAKLIAARQERGSDRDFFFTSLGGWDMHSNMERGLQDKFRAMDGTFKAFVGELKALGVWEEVVLMTASDFAQTLDMNAQSGSDHAWSGQHILFGGAVNGGQYYNKYPASMAAGSHLDLGRGRLIPGYPWESMYRPVAKWLGVPGDQMETVFPNYRNFNATLLNSDVDVFGPHEN